MKYSGQYIAIERDELLRQLQSRVKPKRYRHILGVEKTAIQLAEQYQYNEVEKASIAALLHDFCKQMPADEMFELALRQNPELIKEESNPAVWHGPAAAQYAIEHFELNDEEIIDAIHYHTVGTYPMNLLTQIVFVADYIEPNRTFSGVRKARELAEDSLSKVVQLKLADTIEYLATERAIIYIDTVRVYNEWIKHFEEEE